MNLDDLITCLGWVTLTCYWGYFNLIFANLVGEAINQAIENHNDSIREEFFQELEAEDTEQAEDKS